MSDSINSRIKVLIEEKRLNATSFANKLNCTPQSIRNILSGRNKPSFDILSNTITTFVDVNPLWLLTGKGEIFTTENSSVNKDEIIRILKLENQNLKEIIDTLKEVIKELKK